jgi:hypothetical protein
LHLNPSSILQKYMTNTLFSSHFPSLKL